MTSPTTEQFLQALAKTERLAPAPRTLGRVLQLLRDTDSALHAIADLISRDTALAVDVLRCANSAYYSRGARVAAIDEAVQVIGFHETIRIVSLVVIHQTTNRDLGSYGIAAEDFWAESLYSGLFLEALARQTRACDSGEAYTAGLLRFIGRLAINQTIQDLGGGLFWDGKTPMSAWERANVGVTQAAAGGLLLAKWQFPPVIVAAIENQEAAGKAWDTLPNPLSTAVNFVAHILPAGQSLSRLLAGEAQFAPTPEQHPFVARHAATAEVLDQVKAEAHAAFVAIREKLYPA